MTKEARVRSLYPELAAAPNSTPRRRSEAPQRIQAQVVRCACEVCGTHTNAVKAFRVAGSCPNCGSFRLVPVDGAEPLGGAPLAA
jgi:Zn finger protein HypA/HybF involved in hydrogenase expression